MPNNKGPALAGGSALHDLTFATPKLYMAAGCHSAGVRGFFGHSPKDNGILNLNPADWEKVHTAQPHPPSFPDCECLGPTELCIGPTCVRIVFPLPPWPECCQAHARNCWDARTPMTRTEVQVNPHIGVGGGGWGVGCPHQRNIL